MRKWFLNWDMEGGKELVVSRFSYLGLGGVKVYVYEKCENNFDVLEEKGNLIVIYWMRDGSKLRDRDSRSINFFLIIMGR